MRVEQGVGGSTALAGILLCFSAHEYRLLLLHTVFEKDKRMRKVLIIGGAMYKFDSRVLNIVHRMKIDCFLNCYYACLASEWFLWTT
jgi:hypothetical protein